MAFHTWHTNTHCYLPAAYTSYGANCNILYIYGLPSPTYIHTTFLAATTVCT
jgi:hypothetical protein